MRRIYWAVAVLLCLAALGPNHSVRCSAALAGVVNAQLVEDSDPDDDGMSTGCILCFQEDLQSFDRASASTLSFHPETARFIAADVSMPELLRESGLFRPPRAALL